MKKRKPINNDWDIVLKNEFQKQSFKKMITIIAKEREIYNVFPDEKRVFTAFKLSSFAKTKVVIIGQDPYHSKQQANGLAFSVAKGKKIPPSLLNIFKELKSDLKINTTNNGDLKNWADQGILLLNTILTVREKLPGSHRNIGWEDFTDSVISKLSSKKSGLIFLLWGSYAQNKISLINTKRHHILKTTHPSPFSAYKGFMGCKHFSKTNDLLIKANKKPINWKLCSDTISLF